ncbi:hypothetical protein LUZ61_012608 [Rhynchospora tenuis]|uniref:Cytochrome P450 n=1 Tax=Rhynchospora tenuis TaxID=198213 RepID=A0AAD6A3D5_9POAL|nr:hypothetical protein LUZ61_012608 [Rhynchospora tenuis]
MHKICIQELLSIRRVQSYRSIREEEIGNLTKYLNSCASHYQPVSLSKKLASTVNDITTRALVGRKCKNQEMLLRELETAQNIVAGFNLTDLFPSSRLAKLVSRTVKMAERSHQAINHFLDEVIEQHKVRKIATGESKEEDLLSVLLRLHDEVTIANPLDMETIKAFISDLFSAGSDTSSTTLEWAMSELLRNPTVLEKAQSEIRGLLKGSTTVSESDIDKMQYLHLVLKETLRLHPPGPLFPRQCSEACRVFDYDLPKGTRIFVNAWAIGRRMCVGVSFGLATMSLILANLIYHFDWKLCDGLKPEELDMSEFFGLSARRKTPLLLYAVPHKTNTEINE